MQIRFGVALINMPRVNFHVHVAHYDIVKCYEKRVSCSHYARFLFPSTSLIDALQRLLGVAADLQIESAEGCAPLPHRLAVEECPFSGIAANRLHR